MDTRFKKGMSGNPSGRPLRAINKISRPLKLSISEFLEQRFNELPGIWDALKAKERAQLFCDLLPFVLPKQNNIDFDISLDKLSEEDLNRIVDKLLNNAGNEQKS